ncbi:Predicted transcriptional regulator, ArsR family [Catalinimonas alkaloidigena]|uniref:Predicted transcriptional regulator, ArsR family n=1 Tax=Catalinimonas alkaloidigena TaxID=1075417 RepID=A0A1G9H6K2_9BACT|nr:metalloregulator ArsR/SmtB family transcription factor [Catalinimonas alkaloidigena]SDL08587.1 Predicted transcriptional regulator, ArsR family [Catalinimonas alkaloidigena]
MRTEQILLLLKTRGAMTIPGLAQELGMTGEGARLQLHQLVEADLVKVAMETKGVGRPRQWFSLTAAGHARFPDTHADLTLQLIESIKRVLGEAALDKVIEAREHAIHQRYRTTLQGKADLRSQVMALAEARNREGYMAEVQEEEDAFLLIENHCPICAAATHCQGFCRSELNTFRDLLGEGVRVERVEHLMQGGRRCAYRIRRQEMPR